MGDESRVFGQVAYGHAGWVRLTWANSETVVYARLDMVGGAPRVLELYFDGGGQPISSGLVDGRELAPLARMVIQGEQEWLEGSKHVPGPDLTLLARTFATSYGSGAYGGRACNACGGPLKYPTPMEPDRASDDWTALSWFAQYPDSGVKRPRVSLRGGHRSPERPTPLRAPERLDDAFLRLVGEHYVWAGLTKQRPAPMMAAEAQVSPRTVHSWIAKARGAGHIPPAQRKAKTNG